MNADRRAARDRRRSHRILVDLEVDYQCEDTFLFAYIVDMSALGIFIRTNNPEPPGTHLNLRFTLPGEQRPMALEGEVIWINPFKPGNFENTHPGMGVRFVDLSHEDRRRLLALIRKIAYLEGSAEDGLEDDLYDDELSAESSDHRDREPEGEVLADDENEEEDDDDDEDPKEPPSSSRAGGRLPN